MPLGNLTSQFFANVYLNELDQFVKHKLKVKYYLRYVDDFVVLYKDRRMLEFYKEEIDNFLRADLKIQLHETKSKIIQLERGVNFLGFRIFSHHRLIRKSNLRKFKKNLLAMKEKLDNNQMTYDEIYESLLGWAAYAEQANTYKLRMEIMKDAELKFANKISSVEIDQLLNIKSKC